MTEFENQISHLLSIHTDMTLVDRSLHSCKQRLQSILWLAHLHNYYKHHMDTMFNYKFQLCVMKSTEVQNPRCNKFSAVVETNCLVAEYRIPYLINGLGHATRSATLASTCTWYIPLTGCMIMSVFRAALDLDTYPLST